MATPHAWGWWHGGRETEGSARVAAGNAWSSWSWDGSGRDWKWSDSLDTRASHGGSSEAGQADKARAPKTGKVVPSYDGASPYMRDCRRRVKLFLASTGIDPEFRAGRLVEQLSGQLSGNAWRSTETLDMERLRTEGGVNYLLDHLQAELQPIEPLRVFFSTLHQFFKTFKRSRGEEFVVSYDMNFRSQMQELEEVDAGLTGTVKSWWFECAGISAELRKQVITASGGSYQYERLREPLVAAVPQVKQPEEETYPARAPFHPRGCMGAADERQAGQQGQHGWRG